MTDKLSSCGYNCFLKGINIIKKVMIALNNVSKICILLKFLKDVQIVLLLQVIVLLVIVNGNAFPKLQIHALGKFL